MATVQKRLFQRLQSERTRLFVGRHEEIRFFADALRSDVPPFFLLYVYGPAGTGKSALLSSFASVCHDEGVVPVRIDAREVEISPSGFLSGLKKALGIDASESPISYLASRDRRTVLLVDTFELMLPIEEWFREIFLPQLPEDALVVVASKVQPSIGWRSDPGWQSLMVVRTIGNLSTDEARQYLTKRQVPADQHARILQFTGGHPLALSLIADLFGLKPDTHFDPEAVPDVIGALVKQFLQGVPTPQHRKALYAAAIVLAVSEPLLQQMVEVDDAHGLFDWLRSLSFIDPDHAGLMLHDLARNALTADLRWRNLSEYEQLKARARDYYAERLKQSGSDGQVLREYLFLHRDHKTVQPFLSDELHPDGEPAPHQIIGERPQPGQWDQLEAIIRRHEGDKSAEIADHWYHRQPESALIFKDHRGVMRGLMMIITLTHVTAEDRKMDPATDTMWSYLKQNTPLKPGEAATFVRFWGSIDKYQDMSSTQAAMFTAILQHCLTVPKLAFTFFYCADPLFWTPLIDEGFFARLPEADFCVDGRTYGTFIHDWRTIDPATWLTLWVEGRRMADLSAAARKEKPSGPDQMSRSTFRNHVRDALRDFTAPDLLVKSPLVDLNFLTEMVEDPDNLFEKATALRQAIAKIVDGFASSPRREKLYRAVHYTYIEPQGTQEQVAEYLDLPYSTYRGHLSAGVDLVIDSLWRIEYEGAPL